MNAMSFDGTVAVAIRKALTEAFGASTAKAIDFYFDAGAAAKNPDRYEAMLRKTFLGGADRLIGIITQEVCRGTGVEPTEGMTLRKCLDAVKSSTSK